MSFGKRMRAQRKTSGLLVAALAASVGMGTTVAQAPIVTQSSAQVPREFVHTEPRKATKPAPVVNRVTPKQKKGWDSRKARRRLIMRMAQRENSGRQWKKVRRALGNGRNSAILTVPAWKLAILAENTRIVLSRRSA